MPSQAFIDEVLADIERLTSRDYAEVGVPMILIAEDVSGGTPALQPGPSPHKAELLAAAFEQVFAALQATRPELKSVDISRALELVADRHFTGLAQPEFSRATIRYEAT